MNQPEEDDCQDILVAQGLDDALIGVAYVAGNLVAVYDYCKVVDIIMKRDGMNFDDADDFARFNIVDAYVGPNTPIFVQSLTTYI